MPSNQKKINSEEALRKAYDEMEKRAVERAAELKTTNELLQKEIAGHKSLEVEKERLISDLRDAKEELEKLNSELGQKVLDSTKDLQSAQEKLLRSEKLVALGKLAAVLSHELRNPLGVMRNAVYYLSMKADTINERVQKEYLDILKHQIDIAGRIISDTLDMAKPKELQLKEEYIRKVIDKALKNAKIPRNIKIEKEYKDRTKFFFDPVQMGQVFFNIIENSVHAIKDEGFIKVSLTNDDGFVKIIIADSGIGISSQDLKMIFEPLFSTKARGIGFGMPIIKDIIEQHRGVIDVTSELGRGTEITIRLPITAQG